MLKVILVCLFLLELITRVICRFNSKIRTEMYNKLVETAEDFKNNGNKTIIAFVYWTIITIAILAC